MLLNAKSTIYEMFDTAILDIDSEHDFELMEIIAKYLFDNNDMFRKVQQLLGK